MNSFWRHKLFRQMWHPSYEELLLFLDEPGTRSDKIEVHLRTCWSCQLVRDQVTRVTSAYMEERTAALGSAVAFPQQAVPSFERRLHQLAMESGSPPLIPSFVRNAFESLSPSRYPLRLAGLLAGILVAALVFRLISVPEVSAKKILDEVRLAEREQLSELAVPVFHERFELQRDGPFDRSETVSWEVWRDPGADRFRHRIVAAKGVLLLAMNSRNQLDIAVQRSSSSAHSKMNPIPPAFAELQHFFAQHNVRFEDPLSSGNFQAWSGRISNATQQIVDSKLANGEQAYVVRTFGAGPFPDDGLMSIEWTVRKRDWKPVGERLEFKTRGGAVVYTLGQLSLEVVARDAVDREIFAASLVRAPRIVQKAPPVPAVIEVVPAEKIPSEGDLVAAEIEAWYSFHSVGACLGRPISITRVGNQVRVQGIVEDDHSKTTLLDAVHGIPLVTAEIRTVAEDRLASMNEVANAAPILTIQQERSSRNDSNPRRLAAEALLNEFFAAETCAGMSADQAGKCIQHQIASLSQDVMIASELTLSQAWALRQLASRYGSLHRDALRPSSRRLVELMVRDHLESLHHAWDSNGSRLESMLERFAVDSSAKSDQAATDGGWVATTEQLCTRFERTMNLMLGMFVETNESVSDPSVAASELSTQISVLKALFPQLETGLNAEFSAPPTSLSSADQD